MTQHDRQTWRCIHIHRSPTENYSARLVNYSSTCLGRPPPWAATCSVRPRYANMYEIGTLFIDLWCKMLELFTCQYCKDSNSSCIHPKIKNRYDKTYNWNFDHIQVTFFKRTMNSILYYYLCIFFYSIQSRIELSENTSMSRWIPPQRILLT